MNNKVIFQIFWMGTTESSVKHHLKGLIMKKRILVNLLKEYDQKKSLSEKIFGDVLEIDLLRVFITNGLSSINENDNLSKQQIKQLQLLVKKRSNLVQGTEKDYRNNPKGLTNIIFKRLKMMLDNYHNISKFEIKDFRNQTSLYGDTLSEYGEHELFITDTKYCFVVKEYLIYLESKHSFLNPYTNSPLSDNDIKRLMQYPAIQKETEILEAKQKYCASKISQNTIAALVKLASGLLNKKEIYAVGGEVPLAQKAYVEFNAYYNSMPIDERECLNNYWIGGWTTNLVLGVHGMGPIKFIDLYQSLDLSCVHTVGGS